MSLSKFYIVGNLYDFNKLRIGRQLAVELAVLGSFYDSRVAKIKKIS